MAVGYASGGSSSASVTRLRSCEVGAGRLPIFQVCRIVSEHTPNILATSLPDFTPRKAMTSASWSAERLRFRERRADIGAQYRLLAAQFELSSSRCRRIAPGGP